MFIKFGEIVALIKNYAFNFCIHFFSHYRQKFIRQTTQANSISLLKCHNIQIEHDFKSTILLDVITSELFIAFIFGRQTTQAMQLTELFAIALFLFIHYLSVVTYFFRDCPAAPAPRYFTFNYGDSLSACRFTKAWTSLPRR